MLLSSRKSDHEIANVKINGEEVNSLLQKEWLLANSRGGFSSGTVIGCNTRRYHSILTGTVNPPANRINGLNTCLEKIIVDNKEINISNIEFGGAFSGSGLKYLKNFSRDLGAHFFYDFGFAELIKSIYLLPELDVAAIVYEFGDIDKDFEFHVHPMIAMRDFHSLQHNQKDLNAEWTGDGILVSDPEHADIELFLHSEDMWFEQMPDWWHNFLYRADQKRQQDHIESLWTPGKFITKIDGRRTITLWASLGDVDLKDQVLGTELEIVLSNIDLHRKELSDKLPFENKDFTDLSLAADQFIIERNIENKDTCSILAGFPWFLDWGRDTFIALPGLLLTTGRYEEAFKVLQTFATAVSDGMIPNRFDDYGGEPHYNSIDASMWFINSVFKYLEFTGKREQVADQLLPSVKWIVEFYMNGTRFGIHCDKDGLISGGDIDTQLTWMDAKCNGVAFTPRYGKAVEINALWYNALCNLRDFYGGNNRHIEQVDKYGELASKVKSEFAKLFWNEKTGWLNDCILPDGTIDVSLRPNQIFAVSLKHSPLDIDKQHKVLDVVAAELLTPYGLRTLSSKDQRFKSKYDGAQFERDGAYHQGTVWPFLMGPFIKSYLKLNPTSKAKDKASIYIQALLDHFREDGCIGSISEIFDGSVPQKPKGCFAQAWSVAALLESIYLIKGN